MQNKTSLRSFKMKNANELISNNHSVTTSIGDVPIITMSFPSCPAENLECGGPAFIPNFSGDLSTMQIYVGQRSLSLDDSVNINNITQFEFCCSNITFDITYNKKESDDQWEIFDVTENANANKLRNTLISVQKGLIIPQSQIKYVERLNGFIIYSPNVILK